MGSCFQAKIDIIWTIWLKRHPVSTAKRILNMDAFNLPVSPVCNIQCKFCKRSFNKWEKRPGVTDSILTPEKALEVVDRALKLCPDITVVGIAGPGDTLATPHALDVFELIIIISAFNQMSQHEWPYASSEM